MQSSRPPLAPRPQRLPRRPLAPPSHRAASFSVPWLSPSAPSSQQVAAPDLFSYPPWRTRRWPPVPPRSWGHRLIHVQPIRSATASPQTLTPSSFAATPVMARVLQPSSRASPPPQAPTARQPDQCRWTPGAGTTVPPRAPPHIREGTVVPLSAFPNPAWEFDR
jgi:hypothetical protein